MLVTRTRSRSAVAIVNPTWEVPPLESLSPLSGRLSTAGSCACMVLPLPDAVAVRAGQAVPLLDWLRLLRCYFHHPPAQVIVMLRSYSGMARTARAPKCACELIPPSIGACPSVSATQSFLRAMWPLSADFYSLHVSSMISSTARLLLSSLLSLLGSGCAHWVANGEGPGRKRSTRAQRRPSVVC